MVEVDSATVGGDRMLRYLTMDDFSQGLLRVSEKKGDLSDELCAVIEFLYKNVLYVGGEVQMEIFKTHRSDSEALNHPAAERDLLSHQKPSIGIVLLAC